MTKDNKIIDLFKEDKTPKMDEKFKPIFFDDHKNTSIVMGVSPGDSNLLELDIYIEKLKNSDLDDLKVLSVEYKEDSPYCKALLKYRGNDYTVDIGFSSISLEKEYIRTHELSELEQERVVNATVALRVSMIFGSDPHESYHLQLKLLYLMIPSIVAVYDFNTSRILSGKWVQLAAISNIPPSTKYLFMIHAIGDGKTAWLHSHGLDRCGKVEMEIFDVNIDQYEKIVNILELYCTRVIESELMIEPFSVTALGEGLVTTWKDSEMVIKDLDCLGANEEDRKNHHDWLYGTVFAYDNEENFNNGVLTSLNKYISYMSSNPLLYYSNKETARMKYLAIERISYFLKYGINGTNKAMVKAGLLVDKEFGDEEREYLWFEVIMIDGDKIGCKLVNEPYYISSLREGDNLVLEKKLITDWVIDKNEMQITPDEIYLLDDSFKTFLDDEILNNKELLTAQLHEWHENGDYVKIVDILSDIEDKDYELTGEYARALNNIGSYSDALKELLSVEEEGKEDPRWFYRVAYSYDALGDNEKYLKYIEKTVALGFDDYDTLYMYGQAVFNSGNYEKAKEIFTSTLKTDDIHEDKTIERYTKGYLEECEVYTNSDKYNELIKRAEKLNKEKEYVKVINLLSPYIPNDYDISISVARAFNNNEDYKNAFNLLLAIEDDGKNDISWYEIFADACKGLENEYLYDICIVNIERIKDSFEALPIRDDIFEDFWTYFSENEEYFLGILESNNTKVISLIKESLDNIKENLTVEITRKYEIAFSANSIKENFEYLKRIQSNKPSGLKWIITIIE